MVARIAFLGNSRHVARRPPGLPGIPHHVTQRGNRRQPTFFAMLTIALYLGLLRHWCAKSGTEVWAWCLMPNHVHLVLVPAGADGLRAALAQAHRRYTSEINRAGGLAGPSLAEPLRFLPDGGGASPCLPALCRAQPGPGRAGGSARGLALVERAGASRRLAGTDDRARADAGAGRGLPGLSDLGLADAEGEAVGCRATCRPLGAGAFRDRVAAATGRDVRPPAADSHLENQ